MIIRPFKMDFESVESTAEKGAYLGTELAEPWPFIAEDIKPLVGNHSAQMLQQPLGRKPKSFIDLC